MQTPKASKKGSSEVPRKVSPRANSSEVPQKISPRSISSEMTRKLSPRAVSSEVPQKISPRAVRKLNTTGLESDTVSSSNKSSRTPRKTSPKVIECRSPKSPVPEIQKRRVSKVGELESQISQLQADLNGVKDQLNSSNTSKKQAEQEVDESKKQLLVVSSKLEESKLEELRIIKTQNLSQELKIQTKMVAKSVAKQKEQLESANSELYSLKEGLGKTILVIGDMRKQITNCKESESKASALVDETLLQLDTAKMNVDTLRINGVKATEACDAIAFELDQSRAQINLLEGLVNKLKANLDDKKVEGENEKNGELVEAEVRLVKWQIGQLSLALESAEMRFHEEQIRRTVEIRSAYEYVEEIKSKSSIKEVELEVEVDKAKAYIEKLKADMMGKESQLRGVQKTMSNERENELENKLRKTKEVIENLKANIMEKETEFHNILDENGALKLEMKKNGANDMAFAQLEVARAAEERARARLNYVSEEAEKRDKRETRLAEQLEVARAANLETEAELRRLRVQSDQWRNAAETAVAMLSTGKNEKFVERTGSMDSNYNHVTGKIGSPYLDEMDVDFVKKKNGNVLKRIGILWKKQQK
ncbi:hypothetical protein LguiA_012201 [Lonicera macranthoides]